MLKTANIFRNLVSNTVFVVVMVSSSLRDHPIFFSIFLKNFPTPFSSRSVCEGLWCELEGFGFEWWCVECSTSVGR